MLDEPTEGIQPRIIKDIGRIIRMLADAYVVMERGAVIASGQGKTMEADGVRRLVAI